MHTSVRKSRKHNLLSLVAMLVLLAVSLSGIFLWRMHSVQLMSVESNSMSPAIKRGDAVLVRTTHGNELRVGDVVSYRSPSNQSVIITHRITRVESNWNLIITKGDNAARADNPVSPSEILGKVDVHIAYGGFALNFLRSPTGLVATVYVPALIIVSLELKRLAAYYRRPTYRLAGY